LARRSGLKVHWTKGPLIHAKFHPMGAKVRVQDPKNFISDIAIFVLKRDVKLQLTN